MNERLREQVGLLSALVVSLVMLVCCRDGSCPGAYLSHPAPAPLEAPVPSPLSEAALPPWEPLVLNFDAALWSASGEASCSTAAALSALAAELRPYTSHHHGWIRRQIDEMDHRNNGCCDPLFDAGRVPQPPCPYEVRRPNGPLAVGIKF